MAYKFNSFEQLEKHLILKGFDVQGVSQTGLESSFRGIKIPLEPTYGKSRVKCLTVRCTQGGNKLMVALLWHALFGTKFKVIHNLIIFEIINKIRTWTPLAQIAFDVMMIMNEKTSCDASYRNHFNQNIKPVRRALTEIDLKMIIEDLSSSGLVLPRKAPELDSMLVITEGYIIQTKAPEPARIGVGYKDKGNLPLPGDSYEPTEISHLVHDPINLWKVFLRNYKKKNYLPK